MNRPTILIVGDSHVHAIKDALRAGPRAGAFAIEAFRIIPEKGDKPGMGDISFDQAVQRAAALGEEDCLAMVLRGNQYNMFGLLKHPQPFDFVMPEVSESLEDGASIIPLSLMQQIFQHTLASGYGKLIQRLREAARCKVYSLEIPAPKEDEEHIKRGAETLFRQRGIAEIGVTAAPVRLKLWTMQQNALRAFCAEHNVQYLPCPAGTRDDKGFLDRAYYAVDATHANTAYGHLVLEQLSAAAQSGAAPASAS